MTVSPMQLERLKAFVADSPATGSWRLVEQASSAYVSRHIKVTSEFGWTLMLFPDGPASCRAFCASETERNFAGTWDECTSWLAHRAEEALRLQHQVGEMAVFAGRRSWRFTETGQGARPFVRRLFEFPEVNGGEKVSLFLTLNGIRRAPFAGQVQMAFSAGPVESIADYLGPVIAWLEEWEQALTLPERLRGCSDIEEAERLAARTEWKRLQRLVYLFDLSPSPTPAAARRTLARLFAPAD
jgi:hypothetical protein